MKNSRRKIEVLSQKHFQLLSNFQCNPRTATNPQYFNDYLQYNAYSDLTSGRGVTHVLCKYENDIPVKICAYITLRSSVFITDIMNHNVTGDPAVEISELAVDKNYERCGYGRDLLIYAAQHALLLKKEYIGIRYFIVWSTKKSVSFYKNVLKFSKITDHYTIPRHSWQDNCVPLFLNLDNINI